MVQDGKQFVHLPIDAVDSVLYDPEGHFEADLFDRYATFTEARDAALSSIEVMLDERDYDDDDHRQELERMHDLLSGSSSFTDLEQSPGYQFLLKQVDSVALAAAAA
jgi:hypothetical protein